MQTVKKPATRTPPNGRYSAPALEKGLDILELLADEADGITQKQIAERLGRSVSEIFRMLETLEQRGYVYRKRPEDLYYLTLRLFELSHRQAPTKQLLRAALPVMRRLAAVVLQSCHLAVHHQRQIMIVAQEESPEAMGFRVRMGGLFPLFQSASGRVLLAHQPEDVRARWLADLPAQVPKRAERRTVLDRLAAIDARGYEHCDSDFINGMADVSYAILDHSGAAVAALTVPILAPLHGGADVEAVRAALAEAAADISRQLGWSGDD